MNDFQRQIHKLQHSYLSSFFKVALLLPLLFAAVFTWLFIQNVEVKTKIKDYRLQKVPKEFVSYSLSPYPFLNDFSDYQKLELANSLTARSAIVMDSTTKKVLFGKNENTKASLASTTKIMTALTAMDFFHVQDILTVKVASVEGVTVGFTPNERVTFLDLLYSMMLPSGNDAAVAIAQNYPLGEDEFVERMNENAAKYHLYDTHFSDSAGLNDEGDYSTAYDLARLGSIAIDNTLLAKIVETKSILIKNVDQSKSYQLFNRNRLLGQNGITGVKTGTTEGAGEVLVTSWQDKGKTYIIVVLGSTDRFSDTQKIIGAISGKIQPLSFQ